VSVFDRVDLNKVLRPIPSIGFKPIPEIGGDIARRLKCAFAPIEKLRASLSYLDALAPLTPRPPSRQDVADNIRSAGATVPVDRELTTWEIELIADRVAAKTKRKHRASAARSEADYEVVEPEVGALDSDTDVAVRKGRAVAEPPTERAVRALRLLKKHGLAKYNSLRKTGIVEWLIERADSFELPYSFDATKAELRDWIRIQQRPKVEGKRKNDGVLPELTTLYKIINSLQPIYQELLETMRSKLAAKSEASRAS